MTLKQSNTEIPAETILQALAEGTEIHLDHCRIKGALDLNLLFSDESAYNTEKLQKTVGETSKTLIFSQSVYFSSCTFEDDVVFSGPWEHPERLIVIFEEDVLFNSSVFVGQARFSYGQFKKLAGFDGCTFCRVCTFRNADFHDLAMYRTVTFEGYGLFNAVRFRGDTRFANSCFGKGANFSDVKFENRCDFAGVYSRHKSVPIYDNITFTRHCYGDDASFWRFIKQVCQEAGYYQQAGECFYRERCAYYWHRYRGPGYEKLPVGKKLMRQLQGLRLLPEFVLGRLLFGYGERPTRVLVAAAFIIIFCCFFYSSKAASFAFQHELQGAHQSAHLTFWEGLYYSTVTFTTLGFGDIYPAADMLTRAVTMLEALSGACLMALFVVTLSKRFSRG
ncbi:MAG: potassium channel family protein [Planctomycetota bacterium]